MEDPRIDDVLAFWFGPGAPPPHRPEWWQKDPEFDEAIRSRFAADHRRAVAGELSGWEETARGALALVILIDQFSRNIFRGSPETWAYDPLALGVSERALAKGFDRELAGSQRTFLYMPFMHAEGLEHQDRCVALFEALAADLGEAYGGNVGYAERHREIVARFGRFPHRNAVLGRETTPEEAEFLKEPNSSF